MLLRFFFKQLSPINQARFMQKRGIVIGTRPKDGQQAYLYMFSNLFVEIRYENDNPRNKPEAIVMVIGLKKLNRYLEKDLRTNLF